MTTQFKESEAAKLELVKQIKEMKNELERMKVEHNSRNNTVDYAYLREEVEHLKGSLVLSNLNNELLKVELESVSNDSPISDDAYKFAQQKKCRIDKHISELKRENSVILQELARPSEISIPEDNSLTTFRQFEKQIKSVQDELSQLRNESVHTQRQGKRRSKAAYKRLKKRLVFNEENMKSLAQSLQRDVKELNRNMKEMNKEREQECKHEIWHDMAQMKRPIKQSTGNKVNQLKKEESLDNNIKELKELLEKAIISVQKNENGQPISGVTFGKGSEKIQELENKFQELNKVLQETKRDLERTERKLNERGYMVDELNRQLLKERKDKEEQLMDNERKVNKLQRLLCDSDKNTENLHGRLREISKELEGAKDTLAQRDTELARSKASLREGDDLLNTSRQHINEMQRELEETKRMLIEKGVALEYTEKYAEVLCTSTRNKDFEVGVMTNELLNKVVRDVKRVEKLLQRKTELESFDSQQAKSEKYRSDDQPNDENEANSDQIKVKFLQEREKKIKDLESSIVHLKQGLELSSTSMKEKDNELQQITSDLQRKQMENEDLKYSIGHLKKDLELSKTSMREKENALQKITSDLQRKEKENKDLESSIGQLKEDCSTSLQDNENALQIITHDLQRKDMELKNAKERSSVLELNRNSLHNEMMELKTLLNQQDGEIKESERLIFTRDSELREGSREVEKLRLRLDEKEQSIDILKRGLAEKEHEVNIMTENIKMKLFEIRGLKKTLDNTKIESCKSLEAYQTKNRYLEAVVVRLKNDLESKSVLLRAKDKEITKANIGIQIKEGEVDGFKTLLRRLEEKFALYKQISTEREFKLAQEKKVLEENATHFETHLCQKQNEERPGTESETMDNNSQEENKREESEMKKNENLEVEMAKLAGEQIAVAMTDRIEQMVVDMNVMQAELESKRDENAKLLTDNKELMEQNKVSSKSLNNALDHVRMKRVEIRRLKALKSSADCIVGSEQSEAPKAYYNNNAQLNNVAVISG
ncbi:hypothetical protein OS493_007964 [Desmophyllum pertusum]|uniref:Uncharacterized protein n=1 Tax=Desmophyllum pertusum TaxID=174260 RepID=A0A9W9YF90_9CNID|nr:hypothetical protein OS493_007964 [Desmophyllum pertusum]